MGSRFLTLLAATALMACATARPAPGTRSDPNVITAEEIAQGPSSNVYELIQRVRPNFLRTRGAVHGSPSNGVNRIEPVDLVVYLNENRLGGSDQLRQIPTSDVREIRYYSASDATTKWGTGHSAGAVQVITR